ncbi:MAG: hypothetical protein ACRC67_01335 [Inquilinus sp.]|uniref:hypothetical protein n=1 Tax=Inquilinus sp. TaxID=1932117 RepID=UPI003F368620
MKRPRRPLGQRIRRTAIRTARFLNPVVVPGQFGWASREARRALELMRRGTAPPSNLLEGEELERRRRRVMVRSTVGAGACAGAAMAAAAVGGAWLTAAGLVVVGGVLTLQAREAARGAGK